MNLENKRIVTFPAVTVCNVNAVMCTRLKGHPELNSFAKGLDCMENDDISAKVERKTPLVMEESEIIRSEVDSAFERFEHELQMNTSISPEGITDEIFKKNEFLIMMMNMSGSARVAAGYSFDELIKQCIFDGHFCDERDFIHTLNNHFGNCYTFNSVYKRVNKSIVFDESNLRTVHSPGKMFGLELVFDTIQSEYIPDSQQEAGIQLLVHDPYLLPYDLEAQGEYVSPGGYTSVGVKQSINATIKKNNLPLFKFTGKKKKNKVKQQNETLKTNLDLFSRLFIVMQQREADMDVFFKHENNPTPPALSDGGKLRSGTKSDLMYCLVDTVAEPLTLFDVKVLDGAAVVHMLSVNAVGTFIEYANSVFLPHVVKQLENCQRIDVVWDLPNSIKESTREKRGKGVRRKVLGKNKIPGNWNAFLCDPTNKQELFSFLSDIIATAELPSGKVVAITCGEKVEMNGGVHLMETCDHEEADTQILIHLQDALQHGATTCLVRTVDTDVIVILIGKFYYLLTICPSAEIWVAFGTGKDFRYININAVAQALGIEISTSLPIFHSFTGCDTVSSFYGRGKKTAWQAWKAYKEVTETFVYIASNPFEMLDVTSRHFEQLERYCIILYDKTSSLTSMNDTRKELFCKRNKTMENLPPTQDALINHTKRALYQAGIWT
ncbi:Amiloride-sensitive sodium channel subunit beta [Nymphon striatum]|nr:Amiloride-sensitive sodium channel subunit beta [Nymphon striatum]